MFKIIIIKDCDVKIRKIFAKPTKIVKDKMKYIRKFKHKKRED